MSEDLTQALFTGSSLICGGGEERPCPVNSPLQLPVSFVREREANTFPHPLGTGIRPAKKREESLNVALALLPDESSSSNWSRKNCFQKLSNPGLDQFRISWNVITRKQ